MSSTKYAGIFKRFFAELIDLIIIGIICYVLFIWGQPEDEGNLKYFVGSFLLSNLIGFAYFILFESSLGSTPGKMSLQIAVTDKAGGQISLIQAIIRLLIKPSGVPLEFIAGVTIIASKQGEESPLWGLVFLSFLAIILVIIDCLILVFKPQRQALHDRIAKTVVIDFDGEYKSPQKVLLQLAALAVVSRLIFNAVPETPLSWLKPIAPNTAMIAQPSSSPEPSTPPVPEVSTSPSAPETPTSDKDNMYICKDKVVLGSNSNLDGKWEIQYVQANLRHKVSLSMEGQSGKSITQFFDTEANTSVTIEQDIKLGTSDRGTWLVGFNPVDAKTKKEVKTYSPDNFFLEINPSGEQGGYKCDDSNSRSPMSIQKLADK